MASQDHVFVKIDLVNHKPDALAVARVDRKGNPVASYSDCVTVNQSFSDMIAAMQREILSSRFSKEYVVVAHYAEVERALLKREYDSKGAAEVFNGRIWLSTSQLIWPLVDCQMIPSTSFDSLCAYFGVDHDDSAEGDCTALVKIFFEMMRRYRAALLVEEGVRDFGGVTLDKVRKLVGL